MSPVDPDLHNSNVLPGVVLAAQVLGTSLCLADIVYTLLRAARQLPLSQDTRTRQLRRQRAISIFSVLAVLSFLVTSYSGINKRILSYKHWAEARGEAVPESFLFGFRNITDVKDLQLGRWWKDTSIVKENYEILVARSRRSWWSQQYFLGWTVWTIFLGIEGARRAIPPRTIAAFVIIGQMLGLSVSQNLFNILMLLTPVPLAGKENSSADAPAASAQYTLSPIFYNLPASFSIIAILLTPFSLMRRFSLLFSIWIGIISPLYMSLIAKVAPRGWLDSHRTVHLAHRSYMALFRSIALFSFILHAQQTFIAVLDNAPDSHYPRHDFVWNMHLSEKRTIPEQARTAVGRLLNALNDHPSLTAVGCDLLLSTLSLCVWAVLRNLHVEDMLACSSLGWMTGRQAHVAKTKEKHVAFDEGPVKQNGQLSPTKRPRGRPRKSENSNSNAPATPQLKKSSRRQTPQPDDDSDGDYIPPPSIRAQVENKEHEEELTDEGIAETAESGALSWGLFVLGGFGVANAGVLGAEVSSR